MPTVSSRLAVILAALLALLPTTLPAEDPPPPPAAPAPAAPVKATLAVVPFQARSEILASRRTEVQTIEDALVRTFVRTGKFDVIERAKIEAVMSEHQFATSSFGDPANVSRLGKLLGAQYLVVGNIHELGVAVTRDRIPYVHETTCSATARVRIEMRVVQAETGKIVSAQTADSDDAGAKTRPCGASAADALTQAGNRVAEFLTGKVIDAVYPIRVVDGAAGDVMLNRGEGGDFVVGSTLECFTQGEPIRDPDTGEVLGAHETPVGKIVVREVMPKLTKASAVDGAAIPAHSVCRVVARTPPPKPVKRAPRPTVNF